MSQTSIQLLEVLKSQLLLFFDELIAILPQEKDFIVMRFFIKDQIPIVDVMEYIIKVFVPLEKQVLEKDATFFLEHQVLFENLKEHDSKVNYFKNLWSTTDDDNKEIIWKWFKYFVIIGKKYSSATS